MGHPPTARSPKTKSPNYKFLGLSLSTTSLVQVVIEHYRSRYPMISWVSAEWFLATSFTASKRLCVTSALRRLAEEKYCSWCHFKAQVSRLTKFGKCLFLPVIPSLGWHLLSQGLNELFFQAQFLLEGLNFIFEPLVLLNSFIKGLWFSIT